MIPQIDAEKVQIIDGHYCGSDQGEVVGRLHLVSEQLDSEAGS